MIALPEFPRAQCLDVFRTQHLLGGSPVEVASAGVSGLQHDVGEIFPENQRGGVTEQTLAQSVVSTEQIATQNGLLCDVVGECCHGIDDVVGDRRSQCPREVARVLSGERDAANQSEGPLTKCQRFILGSGCGIFDELLELSPVGRDVDESVARPSGSCRQVLLADNLAGVSHVVEHDGSFDVVRAVNKWPDCCLNLAQGQNPIVVQSEEGNDGLYRFAGWAVRWRQLQWTQDVDPQCGRINWRRGSVGVCGSGWFIPDNDCRGDTFGLAWRPNYGWRRYWSLSARSSSCRVRRWCLSYYVDRSREANSPTSPASKVQMDESRERDHDQGGDEVEQAGERRRAGNWSLLRGARGACRNDGQVLRKGEGDPRRSANNEGHVGPANGTHVFNAHSAIRFDDQRARAIGDGNREVVGRVEETIVLGAVGVVRLIDRVDPCHCVATAGSRDVAKGRSGNRRHARKKVAPLRVLELQLRGSRTRLQGKIDHPLRRVGTTAVGISGVKRGTRYEQHRRQFDMVPGIGDGDLITLVDLVDSGLFHVRGARRHKPADAGCNKYCDACDTEDDET